MRSNACRFSGSADFSVYSGLDVIGELGCALSGLFKRWASMWFVWLFFVEGERRELDSDGLVAVA